MSPIAASDDAWNDCLVTLRPVLVLGPKTYLDDIEDRLTADGIQEAVAVRDTEAVFDWAGWLLARQGISNAAAERFNEAHGSPTWHDLSARVATDARCPRLRSYWSFNDCGYRRSTLTCNTPHHLVACPVANIPARKGALAAAAVSLWLFIRDVCGNNFVGWIDDRLAQADTGEPDRAARMRAALLQPLIEIAGTGAKIWSMVLSELLLGADATRERWLTTGADFVVIDTLVHNFLHRTGILRRLGAQHAYGPRCYAPGGCADVIEGLADRIDAREFSPEFPARFPRWVQLTIWWFCGDGAWAICNGMRIDDRHRCRQRFCPCFSSCERLPLHAGADDQNAVQED